MNDVPNVLVTDDLIPGWHDQVGSHSVLYRGEYLAVVGAMGILGPGQIGGLFVNHRSWLALPVGMRTMTRHTAVLKHRHSFGNRLRSGGNRRNYFYGT